MKRHHWISIAASGVLAVLLASPVSYAATDVSFGVNAPIGDDGRLFFSISSRYFDRDERVVDRWGRRFADPDDLAVFLHICAHSPMSPDVVFNYRRQGLSWYDVGARAGVPADVWYVGPYGYPPGHARKHGHGSRKSAKWSDRECRDFVAVRMAHDYYGVAPEVAMDWRRGGNDVRVMMTREYRTRHGHEKGGREHDDRSDNHHDNHGHNKHSHD